MSYQKVLDLAQKFATTTYQTTTLPEDLKFQAQRELIADFYQSLYHKLSVIISQLGGEFFVLKERKFDHKMLKLLAKVHHDLATFLQNIDSARPYVMAEKLIQYVLNKPNGPVLDNLDFLAKHHIAQTNETFEAGPILSHPKMHSFSELKTFAKQLQTFIAENPLIEAPTQSVFKHTPEGNLQDIPSFFAGKEDVTNPGVPNAKKLDKPGE